MWYEVEGEEDKKGRNGGIEMVKGSEMEEIGRPDDKRGNRGCRKKKERKKMWGKGVK